MRRLTVLLLPIAFAFSQPGSIDKDALKGYESILPADLKGYLSVLSSDSLEGRETTYPGQRKAAEYIAAHFRSLGLKPLGDNGTYFQHFDVDVVRVDDNSEIAVATNSGTKKFLWSKDYISLGRRDTVVHGPVAFVGFMDSKFDSLTQSKLSGRIILAFLGTRQSAFDTNQTRATRRLFASRRDPGAIATLVVSDEDGPSSYGRISDFFQAIGADKGSMTLKGSLRRTIPPANLSFVVSPAVANAVLHATGKSSKELKKLAYEDSSFSPIFMDNVDVTIKTIVVRETKESENVLGFLEGTDQALKHETVVFSAHYDHLGKTSTGIIYHGADDDGSGTSMVMELARAFVKNPIKPKRSLLFMTVAGEEKGLLGSEYYTSHPVLPLEQTVADLNADMIGRMDPKHEQLHQVDYTYVIGSDKISTELDSVLRVANNESVNFAFDYQYNDDKDPNQFYKRSDHYNFARRGIPIVFFFTGTHADYHRPTDTIDKILFDRMAKIGQLVYTVGWKTAVMPHGFTKNVAATTYQ